MVSQTSRFSSPLKLLLVFLTLISIALTTFYIFRFFTSPSEPKSDLSAPLSSPTPTPQESQLPPLINFQPTVDAWANSISGNKSVIIYDLDLNQTVASLNPTKNFSTASLYKLFVVYEGYRRIENGTWQPNDRIAGHTRLQCLDLAIRESHSPCAEALWAEIGHSQLDHIIATDFQITNSKISKLSSNAEDITKIMQLFYSHPDFSLETWIKIQDSMLSQPCTNNGMCRGCCNWRQGLPSGFSSNVLVYNKVGWDWSGKTWNIYHDSAIIEFPKAHRHFIVVVMTNQVSHTQIAQLGKSLEAVFLKNTSASTP